MPVICVPFRVRNRIGRIRVTIEHNDDPAHYGCDVLHPEAPRARVQEIVAGFPVCQADIELDAVGYAAMCGWVQVVRSTDQGDRFELDPLKLYEDVSTPYAFFGIKPTFFDAPHRLDKYDLSWRAHSFLCITPDAVISRRAVPIAAFSWGFDVASGVVTLHGPSELPPTAWDDQLPLLRHNFPAWTFDSSA